jgi:hypothetical protein
MERPEEDPMNDVYYLGTKDYNRQIERYRREARRKQGSRARVARLRRDADEGLR